MRTQIWIVGSAFAVFGAIGWAFTFFSVAYLALIGFGVACFIIGLFSAK
ncbi:MAG: hypothetical protein ACRDGS_05720 [Chloroflexota bacterium]